MPSTLARSGAISPGRCVLASESCIVRLRVHQAYKPLTDLR